MKPDKRKVDVKRVLELLDDLRDKEFSLLARITEISAERDRLKESLIVNCN